MDDFDKRYQEMFQIGVTPEMKDIKINAEYIKQREEEYDRIWNAAIEAAASTIDRLNREGPYMAITGATEIRKLKK